MRLGIPCRTLHAFPKLSCKNYLTLTLKKEAANAGLDPDVHHILEIAVLITDGELTAPHLEVIFWEEAVFAYCSSKFKLRTCHHSKDRCNARDAILPQLLQHLHR